MQDVYNVMNELAEVGFVNWTATSGPSFVATITYRGLVWLTKKGFTTDALQIDALVAEWETTSVEFKRELSTSTADEKAEFIKDVLALANTQASGRRWLIIGFDEQLLAAYADPAVDIRYDAMDYRGKQLGRLEVVRDRRKLPYKVGKDIKGRE